MILCFLLVGETLWLCAPHCLEPDHWSIWRKCKSFSWKFWLLHMVRWKGVQYTIVYIYIQVARIAPRLHLDFIWGPPGFHQDHTWILPGFHLDCTWIAPGIHLDCIWCASGSLSGYLDSTWIQPWSHLDNTWISHGLHLDCTWITPGLYLDHTWISPGNMKKYDLIISLTPGTNGRMPLRPMWKRYWGRMSSPRNTGLLGKHSLTSDLGLLYSPKWMNFQKSSNYDNFQL